ncbi:MAG TPA: hypothetical protein PLC28_18140 [Spirochaetota bacterium]|nr:hypothetical protein [Spirochaetota bacterium]HPL18366.1 hypothetical protein [Spirochaetota bacterium]HQJ72640.1 hypothetical protein [Spirochaetota bacterium]HRS79069.1 hypothetical protein [Spirochaetota bacterium]HRT76951.1 hypothetical protein [Spirochaetota bacterium]
MKDAEKLDLHVDMEKIRNHAEYGDFWNRVGAIEVRCVEKTRNARTTWVMCSYSTIPIRNRRAYARP